MDFRSDLPATCAAARERFSLRLDDELPAEEEPLLERHLRRCADCEAWAAGLDGVVSALREAALAQPSRDLRVPRPGLAARHLGAVGVAAVAALMIAVLSMRVDSRPLAVPSLSPAAARSQLTLKERQATTMDSGAPEPGQNARHSVPSSAYAA